MRALRDELYYKKLILRDTYVDVDLRDDLTFPTHDDFESVGLMMVTSARTQNDSTPRWDSHGAQEARRSRDSDIDSVARVLPVFSVHERKSRARKILNLATCNVALRRKDFFQFKVKDSVYNKDEACCAKECKFTARYGRSFSAGSANCSAGCSRASCKANSVVLAKSLARISAVEPPSKWNAGPSEVAVTV